MAKTSILNWLKSTTRRSKRSSRRSSGSNSSTGGQRSINASSSSDGRISTKNKRSDSEKVKEGTKEASAKIGEKVIEGMKDARDLSVVIYFLSVLIMNYDINFSTKSNSDKDKPPTPLRNRGFAREHRKGMKEAGGKAGDKVKEGIKEAGTKASEKVKEGTKEARAKIGEKVIEG